MSRQYKFSTAVNKIRGNNTSNYNSEISSFDDAVENIRAKRQNTDYLTEIYFITDENAFKKNGEIDIDALNASIESGEFFTYEGIEGMKF